MVMNISPKQPMINISNNDIVMIDIMTIHTIVQMTC